MAVHLLAIAAGFAALVWGADRFVVGSATTARNLGVSPLIIGLTIVGFGTSAPEVLVSAVAAWQGNPVMGIGNALGSNITNIALVLGLTAMITPLRVHSDTLKREFPILFIVMFLAFMLLLDGNLSRVDGIILMAGLLLQTLCMVIIGLRTRKCEAREPACDPLASEFEAEIRVDMSTLTALIWVLTGSVVLLGSSRVLVWGAVNVAETLGLSDLVIGLTIVALGTSLPELAASVMSAVKGEHDIALGNVLGSNMYNLLAVMAMPGLIRPGGFERDVISRDYTVMSGLTLLLFATAYGFRGRAGHISRLEGAGFFICYAVYVLFLYYRP